MSLRFDDAGRFVSRCCTGAALWFAIGSVPVLAELATFQGPEPGPYISGPELTPLPPIDEELPTLENSPRQQTVPAVENSSAIGPDIALGDEPFIVPVEKVWEGGLEFGLNGSDGNSETLNYRFGAKAKRTVPGAVLTLDANYKREEQAGAKMVDLFFFIGRNEWLIDSSPWSIFLENTVEADDFQAFDARVALNSGLAYKLIETEFTKLKGRFGAGVMREYGGPNNDYVPEGVFGLSIDRQLGPDRKLTANVEYYPDWSNFNDFRMIGQAGLEMLLSAEYNLTLKLGVLDRYDSTPYGKKPNDVDYYTTILWNF